MTSESSDVLERLLRDNDLGWMIDMYAPRERAIPFLLEQLANLTTAFQSRFKYEVSFTPETLKAEAERNPHKIRAFLQALGVSRNPDILLMVWRILQGLSIREVAMNYREQEKFSLSVTLARPGEGQDALETYDTHDIKDAALLSNFGIMTVNGQPLFDGFFPRGRNHVG
jgi:hypothetical protein